VPVVGEVDVLVTRGGPAGIVAATAAALSVQGGVVPREYESALLRETLDDAGVILPGVDGWPIRLA